MSQADKENYRKIKTDPVKWAAYKERKRRDRAAKKGYETERKRRWRAANPDKTAAIRLANRAVEKAIREGVLVRPKNCSRCGWEDEIEGHHPSYEPDKRLDVIWLCQGCHSKEHHPDGA